MSRRGGPRAPRPPPGPPVAVQWQVAVRGAAIVAGLTLLLIVDVHGFGFYVAWSLIVLAALSEAAATLVYRRRGRRPQ